MNTVRTVSVLFFLASLPIFTGTGAVPDDQNLTLQVLFVCCNVEHQRHMQLLDRIIDYAQAHEYAVRDVTALRDFVRGTTKEPGLQSLYGGFKTISRLSDKLDPRRDHNYEGYFVHELHERIATQVEPEVYTRVMRVLSVRAPHPASPDFPTPTSIAPWMQATVNATLKVISTDGLWTMGSVDIAGNLSVAGTTTLNGGARVTGGDGLIAPIINSTGTTVIGNGDSTMGLVGSTVAINADMDADHTTTIGLDLLSQPIGRAPGRTLYANTTSIGGTSADTDVAAVSVRGLNDASGGGVSILGTSGEPGYGVAINATNAGTTAVGNQNAALTLAGSAVGVTGNTTIDGTLYAPVINDNGPTLIGNTGTGGVLELLGNGGAATGVSITGAGGTGGVSINISGDSSNKTSIGNTNAALVLDGSTVEIVGATSISVTGATTFNTGATVTGGTDLTAPVINSTGSTLLGNTDNPVSIVGYSTDGAGIGLNLAGVNEADSADAVGMSVTANATTGTGLKILGTSTSGVGVAINTDPTASYTTAIGVKPDGGLSNTTTITGDSTSDVAAIALVGIGDGTGSGVTITGSASGANPGVMINANAGSSDSFSTSIGNVNSALILAGSTVAVSGSATFDSGLTAATINSTGTTTIGNTGSAVALIGPSDATSVMVNGGVGRGWNFEVNGTAGGNFAWQVNACDARLKQNVATLDPAEMLEKINLLRPVSFGYTPYAQEKMNLKALGAEPQLGFIAQEVRSVIPEVTHECRGSKLFEDGVLYTMTETKLLPALVGACQELSKQRDELKAAVYALAKRVQTLEEQHEAH